MEKDMLGKKETSMPVEQSQLHNHDGGLTKLLHNIPQEHEFGMAAEVFSQLSDGTRLRILWLLCHSEECVNDIAAAVRMTAPAVSHHLKTLRQTGIIKSRRVGKEVLYTLEDTPKAILIHKMVDSIFEINCGVSR
jgi:DNA-binding transcriptional ArsR family regulator